MVQYACPKCGELMSSPDSMVGQSETCKVCGNVAIVPGQRGVASVTPQIPPLPLVSGGAVPVSDQSRAPSVQTIVETVSRWRILRGLVEEKIQEQLGGAEVVVALVGAYKGHRVLGIIVTLLLCPLTLLLMGLLIIPGLIWLLVPGYS